MAALEIVRRVCPDSMITMHMVPSATLPDAFAEKVDLYMYQSGHGAEQMTPYELAKVHNEYAAKRPVVNGEPCYEGHGKGRALTPWQEQAHQDLMRLLAQYEACRSALRKELDVEPGEETTRLYARIRDGELGPPRQAEVGAISISRKTAAAPHSPEFPPRSHELPSPPQPPPPTAARQRSVPTAGERRTVTALVAAVAGSTLHGEPIDIELRAEVMRHILPTLDGEVERYGVEVAFDLDDGLVALFGASATHEDDPERAVLAALAVGEAIQPYTEDLAWG